MTYLLNRSYLTLPGDLQPAATPEAQPGQDEKKPDPENAIHQKDAAALLTPEEPDQLFEETENGHS